MWVGCLECVAGYLHVHVGIDFACNGVWDVHVIKNLCD